MPRFQMDDSLYDDPAVIRAGTAAFGLYARCGDYVARQLLDGYVPSEIAAQWGTPEWTGKLLAVGLWKTVPGGFHMPRYLGDNPSRERVLAERERKAERQRRWLEKKRSPSPGQRRVSRRSSRRSAESSRDGPADMPQPPSLTGRKGGRARENAPPPAPLHTQTPAEATLAAGVTANGQPATPEAVAHHADTIRQTLRKTGPP